MLLITKLGLSMSKSSCLVLVESPGKCKSIQRYLTQAYPQSSWEVIATKGHLFELPKKQLGINLKSGQFELDLKPMRRQSKTILAIRSKAKKASQVFVATDDDREGEFIASCVYQIVGSHKSIQRAVFSEITHDAIAHAFSPDALTTLHANRVEAQRARRAIDRLLGYKISPYLWKSIGPGTSAGRVQACVLKEITHRTIAILNHKPEDYYTLTVPSATNPDVRFGCDAQTEAELQKLLPLLSTLKGRVKEKQIIQAAPTIFHTSDALSFCATRYKMPASATMAALQKLYEAGMITYHRTTSHAINPSSAALIADHNRQHHGQDYSHIQAFSSSSSHEGIRPTDIAFTPDRYATSNTALRNVYTAIWFRACASQSTEAKYIQQSGYFKDSAGNKILTVLGDYGCYDFDGYHKVSGRLWASPTKSLSKQDTVLDVTNASITAQQTRPPYHHTDAHLVAWMEKVKVGRPSTFSATLTHLLYFKYASKTGRGVKATNRGMSIVKYLSKFEEELLTPEFTARMEKDLDRIELGKLDYVTFMRDSFAWLTEKLAEAKGSKITSKALCPNCQTKLYIRAEKRGEPYLKCATCAHRERKITFDAKLRPRPLLK